MRTNDVTITPESSILLLVKIIASNLNVINLPPPLSAIPINHLITLYTSLLDQLLLSFNPGHRQPDFKPLTLSRLLIINRVRKWDPFG